MCWVTLNLEVICHSHCYVLKEEANTETAIYSTKELKMNVVRAVINALFIVMDYDLAKLCDL